MVRSTMGRQGSPAWDDEEEDWSEQGMVVEARTRIEWASPERPHKSKAWTCHTLPLQGAPIVGGVYGYQQFHNNGGRLDGGITYDTA